MQPLSPCFKEWEHKDTANKMWINLKPFMQEACQHRLNAMGNTTGQHGYMQNAFAILKESKNDDNIAMVMTQMANLTMQSQLATASLVAMSSSVTLAIYQLAANQQAMMQQMMASPTLLGSLLQPPQSLSHSSPFLLHWVELRMVAKGVNADKVGMQLDLALEASVTYTHHLPTM
jgi:hypothetical protein